jgi:parallel beta-helix repeat protein
VQGNLSYPGGVILKRNANIYAILYVTGASVTVKNLVLDGNKAAYPGGVKHDLDFVYPSWNNFVISSTFKNAPDKAVNAQYYTYVQYCNFYDAEHVGVLTWASANNTTDIGIYNSYFTRTGANAVYMQSGLKNSIIFDSDFVENHKTCSWGSPGGQILIDATTSGIWVQNNLIDGNYSYCSSYPQSSAGVEAYGTSHVITGNTAKRHRWFGMYFTGASNIQISSNTIENNGLQANSDGIRLFGQVSGTPCASNPTYSISNNQIRYNYGWGIKATRDGCTGPNTSTVTLSGNTFVGNGLGNFSIPVP